MVIAAGEMLIGCDGVTVIVAVVVSVENALLVALIVAVVLALRLEGAVYRPEDETDPGPETLHVTAVFMVPVIFAENCSVEPEVTVALAGEIEIVRGTNLTGQEALYEEETVLVAVTVAMALSAKFDGAV